jgi:alkanesulfonate monooxygenase SsuD/methylene tetrahydromethanopterin reductase-like flavin-dependent oxidoreductase (luciferase family)
VHYGLYLPNFGECCSSALELARLAREAEESGWDGFFIWDHVLWQSEGLRVVDPWVALTAIAINTKRIRIGPLVTPLARRRPWKLARETVSLDHLSKGRLILGVGLGNPPYEEFIRFGESGDDRVRGCKLDEALDILVGLWSGKTFSYVGKHYEIRNVQFLPTPLQSPRIPIWVAGKWPNKAPFRRAARWDGVFPLPLNREDKIMPHDLLTILAYIARYRSNISNYDLALTGSTPSNNHVQAVGMISPYVDSGLTWWLEDLRKWCDSPANLSERIRQGPPKS